MTITIWHNPACSHSRAALARLQDLGVTPDIYLYLEARPSKAAIAGALQRLELSARDVLRVGDPLAQELGLVGGGGEDAILSAMVAHPQLIQRPIVLSEKGAVIARPAEKLDALI